jgi:hypothetical protein
MPLKDPIEEASRLLEEAKKRNLTIRLIGGLAIFYHCKTAGREPFKRGYRDIDFVGLKSQSAGINQFMKDLGYEPNERYNIVRTHRAMYFDLDNEREIDYLLDIFEMCHRWDLRQRLKVDYPTIPIEDLLLSKLQIVEVSERDIKDTIAILADHPLGGGDPERIDPEYIANLCSEEWGLYKTVTMSVNRIKNYLAEVKLPIDVKEIQNRLDELLAKIEQHPKSTRWKLRSLLGEKTKWYEMPEEAIERGVAEKHT